MNPIKQEFGEKLEKLEAFLDIYENDLNDFEENLRIRGKSLETANLEQAQWFGYYGERKVELKRVVDLFETERNRIKYVLFKNAKLNMEMSDSLRLKYIEQDNAYLEINRKYLNVVEIYSKYINAVETFLQRGYSLRNLTNARVASVHNDVLDAQ